MDFETPSGISDAPASQKTVLESTRTSGAQQSFRLELSEITPTSSSTPSISSSRAGSSVSVNPARIPFQTLLDELQVAESTAIDEDMMDMEDGEKDEEERVRVPRTVLSMTRRQNHLGLIGVNRKILVLTRTKL